MTQPTRIAHAAKQIDPLLPLPELPSYNSSCQDLQLVQDILPVREYLGR